MGRGLDNRQQVKNPKKRERYTEPRKAAAASLGTKQRREQLERLKKNTSGGKAD